MCLANADLLDTHSYPRLTQVQIVISIVAGLLPEIGRLPWMEAIQTVLL